MYQSVSYAYHHNERKLETWEATRNDGLYRDRATWDQYRPKIIATIGTYNRFLQNTPGFIPLNWQIVQTLIWVESSPYKPYDVAWKTRPMQIGNAGDPGLDQMLNKASGKLLLPPEYKNTLTMANARSNAAHNIEVGVGYFLWGFARFGLVEPPQVPVFNLSPQVIQHSQKGQKSAHKPQKILTVVGWKPITLEAVALQYNSVKGDEDYLAKLRFCFDLVTGKTTPKAPQPPAKKGASHKG